MGTKPRTIVGDLAEWELPSLEDRIDDLILKLRPKMVQLGVDEATFGALLDALPQDRVRELGATVANEVICGWLQGNADGCLELCTEFPYLEGDDDSEPLTVSYSVGAEDGSRVVINRIDLECTLLDAVVSVRSKRGRRSRAKAMATRLKTLAAKLEQDAGRNTPGSHRVG
jgi:hypothetical protein